MATPHSFTVEPALWIPLLLAAGAAALTAVTAWVRRSWKPGGRENVIIDQLQEDLAGLRALMHTLASTSAADTLALRQEVSELRNDRDITWGRLRAAVEYGQLLRSDIFSTGGSPRPWPVELLAPATPKP